LTGIAQVVYNEFVPFASGRGAHLLTPEGPGAIAVTAEEQPGMAEESDRHAFYVVESVDASGTTARGPFTMQQAEASLGADETIITRRRLKEMTLGQPADGSETYLLLLEQGKMHSAVRKWGIALVVLGALQLLPTGSLDPTWGVLLIIVGLSSFYFRSTAMFVVYGFVLAWASITNALIGNGFWFLASMIQAAVAVRVFWSFRTYRQMEFSLATAAEQGGVASGKVDDRSARIFPWLSLVLGLLAFAGVAIAILLSVFCAVATCQAFGESVAILIEGLSVSAAILALSAGVAALLMRYGRTAASIIGVIAASLIWLLEIGLMLLMRFG
jgi:hypothetical protein